MFFFFLSIRLQTEPDKIFVVHFVMCGYKMCCNQLKDEKNSDSGILFVCFSSLRSVRFWPWKLSAGNQVLLSVLVILKPEAQPRICSISWFICMEECRNNAVTLPTWVQQAFSGLMMDTSIIQSDREREKQTTCCNQWHSAWKKM